LGVADSNLENTGFGLFALEDIPANTIIGIYTGEYINSENDPVQYPLRTAYKALKAPSYLYDLTPDPRTSNISTTHTSPNTSGDDEFNHGFIDALGLGNLMRYANHHPNSKQVNIVSVQYLYQGERTVFFKTKSLIREGQELFLNYGKSFFDV
jgi:SET domain-containing protein